jgi:hypothetical protein
LLQLMCVCLLLKPHTCSRKDSGRIAAWSARAAFAREVIVVA